MAGRQPGCTATINALQHKLLDIHLKEKACSGELLYAKILNTSRPGLQKKGHRPTTLCWHRTLSSAYAGGRLRRNPPVCSPALGHVEVL